MATTVFNTEYKIANANSTKERSGRYAQGGATSVFPKRLGWWERTNFPLSETDIPFLVTKDTEVRPDLIAYKVYGRPSLLWLVLMYNNIIDINVELVTGTTLRLPTPSRVNFQLLTKTPI